MRPNDPFKNDPVLLGTRFIGGLIHDTEEQRASHESFAAHFAADIEPPESGNGVLLPFCTDVDQGRRGQCVGATLAQLISIAREKAPPFPSYPALYADTRTREGQLNNDGGCSPTDAIAVLGDTGWCALEDFPPDSPIDALPPESAYLDATAGWIKAHRIDGIGAARARAVRQAIGVARRGVAFDSQVGPKYQALTASSPPWDGEDPGARGVGGHEQALVDYFRLTAAQVQTPRFAASRAGDYVYVVQGSWWVPEDSFTWADAGRALVTEAQVLKASTLYVIDQAGRTT